MLNVQVAPGVRNGCETIIFKGHLLFGRVINKVNTAILDTPCIGNLVELYLYSHPYKRPTADELEQTFSSLFSM